MGRTLSEASDKVGGASSPECHRCGCSGPGVLFSIFSPYGFGTYCKPCEYEIDELLDEGEK